MGPDYSEGMANRSSNDQRSVVARFLDTPKDHILFCLCIEYANRTSMKR
jgi:hypothetical protein